MRNILFTASLLALALSLSACGGSGGSVNSASGSVAPPPPPVVTPPPPPVTTPTQPSDTNEYKSSPAAVAANAGYAYDKGFTGKGVEIAVIDSGIDVNNSEFAGRISPDSKSFDSTYAPCATCDPKTAHFDLQDTEGHGTWVAGAAAAAHDGSGIQGIAYDATILALKTVAPDMSSLDANGNVTKESGPNVAALPAAINYAVDKGAFVMTYSVNGYANGQLATDMKTAMDNVRAHNLLFVESVSNDKGQDSFSGQIAQNLVGADMSNKANFLFGIAVDSSLTPQANNGVPGALADRTLAVVADNVPGVKIGGGTEAISGNSFAAPVIAGAAAVLKQYWPQLGGKEIAQILLDTAKDLGPKGVDQVYGAGLLDLAAAMQAQAPTMGAYSGGTTSVANTSVIFSGAFGGSAGAGKFSGKAGSSVVLDKYGRDYTMAVSSVTGAMRAKGIRLGALRSRYGSQTTSNPSNMDQPYNYAGNGYGTSLPEGQFAYMLGKGTVVSGAVNSDIDTNNLVTGSMLEQAGLATYGERTEINHLGYRIGFAHARNSISGASSSTNRMSFGLPNGLTMALTTSHETGSALGMQGNGAFRINGADSTFVTLGWSGPIAGGWNLTGEVMGGTTKVDSSSDMLAFKGSVLSTGFRFEAAHNLLGGNASFGLTSPVKVERAEVRYSWASGYDVDTEQLITSTKTFNIAPSAREMNLELGWSKTLSNKLFVSFAGAMGFNSGNIAGRTDHAAWLRLSKEF